MDPTASGEWTKRPTRGETSIQALSGDMLSIIFSFLDIIDLIRCSAVCNSWKSSIDKSKLLHMIYCKQQWSNSTSPVFTWSDRSLKTRLQELAMDRHRFSLQEGPIDIYQWKNVDNKRKNIGVDKCCMKMGLVLTGGGSKAMHLWSVERYKCLDAYSLPDKAPLVDFDFDESKVVGLIGTRICIWKRNGFRNIYSSREGEFMKGSCMRYVDPEAVVGCEDGRARVFDMYSRNWSQIIKIHDGPVTCLSLSADQLIIGGSSIGSITVTCPSSNQRVATLKPIVPTGISTLCFNPYSHLLFAGSYAGHASCWDLRTKRRPVWETRVSPNVIHSINHQRNDTSALVVGGIDGVLRVVDQSTGEVLSRSIIDESSSKLNYAKGPFGFVEKKKARRISEDIRLDLMPKASRPSISCLAVGMQKVVTIHDDNFIRVWKFN